MGECLILHGKTHAPTHLFPFFLVSSTFVYKSRDRATLFGTLGQTVVILILVGFAFFRLGRSQADVLSRIGVLFFVRNTLCSCES